MAGKACSSAPDRYWHCSPIRGTRPAGKPAVFPVSTKKTAMKTVLTAALLALLAVQPASAQVAGGSITGTVTDEQKAVLPGVTVTIQGSDRTQTAITDDTGKFRFLNQPPGTYTVTVTNGSCSLTSSAVTITQPTAVSVTATSGSISCNGGSTTMTVSATGGVGSYTGTGSFTVTAGTYTYTVTDASGCPT